MDIGGTKIVTGILENETISILARFPTPHRPEEAVRRIVGSIRQCRRKDFSAIGIGAPGPLDPEEGVILSPPNLPKWHDFPLAPRLEAELEVPAWLDNDANLGALGEAIHGSGRGLKSIFYFISTGIGSGLIIDGRIHRGRVNYA